MWVFLASNDCCSSSRKLKDSSIDSENQYHAVAESTHVLGFHQYAETNKLGFHEKQKYTETKKLGFDEKQQYIAEQGKLGFHEKVQYAGHVELGFHDKLQYIAEPEFAVQDEHDKLQYAEPAQLGLHDKLQYAGAAQLGFHDAHQHAETGNLGFHRRLMNSGTVAINNTAAAQVSPSIVVIIIVLTVIFFLSAFLHLLIRWLARNPALIRRHARTGTHTGSNNRIIALTALQGQLQQLFSIQDAGLERSLIDELPVFSYKAAMDGLKEGADCAICLCEFVGDDQLRLLPSCGHVFHTDCIDTWLLSHSTCPLCRTLLLPECWIPSTLHPLLSSEISTGASEADNQHALEPAVPSSSGRFTGFGSSSRHSSLNRITIIAGIGAPLPVDHAQSQLAVEPGSLYLNPNPASNHVDSVIPRNSNFVHPVSLMANPASLTTNPARGIGDSARLTGSDHDRSHNFTDMGMIFAPLESEDHTSHNCYSMDTANEETSSSNAKSLNGSNIVMDSGRLSYTSLGNQTDAQSETFNELERASTNGSGRRVSVHFGKCRIVHEQGKSAHKSKASGCASSRRSYSKGSYEFVIDSSLNVEVLIPPVITRNSHSTPPALISGSRLNDLLNLSHRTSSSSVEVTPNSTNGFHDLMSKNVSPSWASASFRKLRLCNREDHVDNISMSASTEAMNAPLNTSLPSDKPVNIDHIWPGVVTAPELVASSAATSMRALVGSDASFSPGMIDPWLGQFMVGSNPTLEGSSKSSFVQESSKRAVSFRLPTSATHNAMSGRLKASASRRALSESEAFSYWEPSVIEDYCVELDHASDDRRRIQNNNPGTDSRSSSFAKRTMDWLVGWRRRMVHPDIKCVANSGSNPHT